MHIEAVVVKKRWWNAGSENRRQQQPQFNGVKVYKHLDQYFLCQKFKIFMPNFELLVVNI
jgi:hypothetical protein